MTPEERYHNKYPVVNKDYAGRPLPGTKDDRFFLDIRHFVWADDYFLSETAATMRGKPLDEIAHAAQKYVVKELKYVGDDTLGCSDYWMFPQETVCRGVGDCEDGAILMASLLLNAIPKAEHWRVRVVAGWVQAAPTAPKGGHAYVGYCRESDDRWVILDWCYLEDSRTAVKDKPLAKDRAEYLDVWFSFNHLYSWSHEQRTMEGRVR
jgi:hypothetical protein